MKTYQEFLMEAESIPLAQFNKEVKKIKKAGGTPAIEVSSSNVTLTGGSSSLVLFSHKEKEFLDAKEKQFKVWLKKV